MAKQKEYIQVGFTAMRDPADGSFMPAVPLYIEADQSASAGEENLINDLGALLAQRMKRYMESCEAAGVAV